MAESGKRIEALRKSWNVKQKALRRALLSFQDHKQAIDLFFEQHAVLHSARMLPSTPWSFEDMILSDLNEDQIRCIPTNSEHSITWVIWHLARIEDVTMNLLVAGTPQIIDQDSWFERMKSTIKHTGNAMDLAGIIDLSAAIDVAALRAYRVAVGLKARAVVSEIQPDELDRKVDPSRLQQVIEEGAVIEDAIGIVEYWGRRNIAGLLLMPPTRHCFIHLNEALRIKQRCK